MEQYNVHCSVFVVEMCIRDSPQLAVDVQELKSLISRPCQNTCNESVFEFHFRVRHEDCLLYTSQYSYADGDQWFQWSPDSQWILSDFIGIGGWNNKDVVLDVYKRQPSIT